MEFENVFQLFSPIHPAWLYRRCELNEDVVAADLDSIEANFAAAIHDPLFVDYRRRAEAGTLRRRPGRKPNSCAARLRLQYASFEIDDEMEAIWRAAGWVLARVIGPILSHVSKPPRWWRGGCVSARDGRSTSVCTGSA